MRRSVKELFDILCRALVALPAAMCGLERRMGNGGEALFSFWAQVFAIVPGVPGVMLRRGFYRMTLDQSARSFHVGFGACFTHRRVAIEDGVFLGTYALVGCSRLRRGCMVGSRASLLSGTSLHELDANGEWAASELRLARQIEIGEHALIGEGAIVMADVGPSALVAAGAVVSTPVPRLTVVAGNPARFVRHLSPALAGGTNEQVNAHAH